MMWRVGTVVALQDETATARTITLKLPDWPGHIAGQHVDVRLTASDGYSAVRSYSIASAPNSEGRVELTVERLPNGEVSPYLTQEVAIGDPLEVRGPIGGWFVWRAEQTEPVQLHVGEVEAVHGDMRHPRLAGAVERAHQMLGERRLARAGGAGDTEDGPAPGTAEGAGADEEVVEGQRHTAECVIRRRDDDSGSARHPGVRKERRPCPTTFTTPVPPTTRHRSAP